jgi:hypothetical protein
MKERIARLKEILRTATEFKDPWDYFHDELVADPAFMQMGHRQASRKLAAALDAIGSELVGRQVKSLATTTIYVKEHQLWHGSVNLAGNMGLCFYFEDVDQGLLGLMMDPRTNEVLFARMSLLPIPEGTTVVTRRGQA